MQEFEQARRILSKKNSGPSGILAFTMANDTQTFTVSQNEFEFQYSLPVVKRSSSAGLVPYYAVVRSNRTGVEVVTPPGGTQDIIFDLDGVETYAELVKPQKQIQFLRDQFNVELSKINDKSFVATLLKQSRISNLRLEDAFSAAARETAEEHGWNYKVEKSRVQMIEETDHKLLSKRSFNTNPPTPISQKIFVMRVADFSGSTPVWTDKIETKIESLLGQKSYEYGDYMSLAEMEKQLSISKMCLGADLSLPEMANIDVEATESRLKMVANIQRKLMP